MSSGCPPGKYSWPELRGKNGDYAASVIEDERPDVNAVVVLEGSVVTADVRCDRVRVWVDTNHIVFRTPTIG